MSLSQEDLALAGEYVLGVLGASERARVARRVAEGGAFAREVAAWEARLDALSEEVAPLAPPAALYGKIEARLFEPAPRGFGLFSGQFSGWFVGASALAASVLAAVLWLGQPLPPEAGPMYISDMVSQDGAVRLAALYNARSGEMRVSMGGQAPAKGRDFELWLIAGQQVVSLGVMPREGAAAMPIPEALRPLLADATLAITDEPQGGAPAGVATGPLLAKAALRRI